MLDEIKSKIHEAVKNLPPAALVIFGATGDLTLHYLMPTLLHMDTVGLLPETFRLVCAARREMSTEQYIEFLSENMSGADVPFKEFSHFARHISYYQGDFADPESFKGLVKVLDDVSLWTSGGHQAETCYNRLYYFATAPEYFELLAKILKSQGLLVSCSSHNRKIRVVVEKPFGENLPSAQALNKLLLSYFTEEQIYRIDHYLGKETVQNLMVARFANNFLEPVWNAEFIDYVEIVAMEAEGLGRRAEFYNQTGALKDFVQNHLLNMLALIAMDRPKSIDSEAIRSSKVEILAALKPYTPQNALDLIVRAQYTASQGMPGFLEEIGQASQTESFVAMKVFLNLPRWQGVPFYLRTGKRLPKKLTEISVHFKPNAAGLFTEEKPRPNVLVFRIQPDESVSLYVNNKIPGFGMNMHYGSLDFGYKTAFLMEMPQAYERLLLDFMQGDQRLFIRSDEIEAAWQFVDSVTGSWADVPLVGYLAGSQGPQEAEELINRDGREWWTR